MHNEIFTTLLVFLTSANREIVKSILGFVKLAIHTLPADLIRPHLKELVPALLGWSHDHKNHFKAKVRHIFERMLRRFGWDEVYSCAGEEEAAKVLVNIKKRKERAKRKKAHNRDDEDDEDVSGFPRLTVCRSKQFISLRRFQQLSPLLEMRSKTSCMEVRASLTIATTSSNNLLLDLMALSVKVLTTVVHACVSTMTSRWIFCRVQLLVLLVRMLCRWPNFRAYQIHFRCPNKSPSQARTGRCSFQDGRRYREDDH